MGKVGFSVLLVTSGMIIFTILCNANLNIPTGYLLVFLFLLHIGLIWMVVTILRHGKPSGKTFDQQYYDDVKL